MSPEGASSQLLRAEGLIKAFRRRVVADLAVLPDALRLHVIAGRTGSGR